MTAGISLASVVGSFAVRQAAIALAKRGENLDRCFIGVSPGGVGQSLYSLHLQAQFGCIAYTQRGHIVKHNRLVLHRWFGSVAIR